jgi:hypothetical protein
MGGLTPFATQVHILDHHQIDTKTALVSLVLHLFLFNGLFPLMLAAGFIFLLFSPSTWTRKIKYTDMKTFYSILFLGNQSLAVEKPVMCLIDRPEYVHVYGNTLFLYFKHGYEHSRKPERHVQ